MSSKPLVTFALFSYNQEDFIADAIQGALSQTYSPLEIYISDDCSTDKTYEIIENLIKNYQGCQKVSYFKNERNLGIARHINKINSISNGELIVVAAGDDISKPERTDKIVEEYISSHMKANYFYSTAIQIGLDGTEMDIVKSPGFKNRNSKWKAAMSPYPVAIGATQAWTKLLVNSFPLIAPSVWAEDQILGVRGLLLGPICNVDEPLVYYRVGSGISTKRRKSSIKKYFSGKISDVMIYQQRSRDAWHVNNYILSTFIAVKALFLLLFLPLAPLFSALRKIKSKRHA